MNHLRFIAGREKYIDALITPLSRICRLQILLFISLCRMLIGFNLLSIKSKYNFPSKGFQDFSFDFRIRKDLVFYDEVFSDRRM
jgi:hypothetical protein